MSAPWEAVARRAGSQPALLSVVLAVMVVGTTLLGTCALLLTTGQEHALIAAMHRAAPAEVDATASLDIVRGDATELLADVDGLLTAAFAPLGSTTSTWVQSAMLTLPASGETGGPDRQAYLESADDVAQHATLTAGRWPATSVVGGVEETAVPAVTATLLGLSPGSTVHLAAEGPSDATNASPADQVSLVVVGIFEPTGSDTAAWDRDALDGAGYHPAWERPGSAGWVVLPTYGPFVVGQDAVLGGAPGAAHLSLVVHPRLDGGAADALGAVRDSLGDLAARLVTTVGDRGSSVHLATAFPQTIADAGSQQRVTRSVELVLALTAIVLAGATLSLAGVLVTGRRRAETALLAARGAGRLQLVTESAVESVALAVVSAAVAVPLSLASYRGLLRLPLLADAGIHDSAAATPALVLTVVVAALILAAVLVAPSLRRPEPAPARSSRRGTAARTGADLLLVVLALVGYLQLRDHRASTDVVDPVLVVAPVLCLVAASTVSLRVVPWVARLAERHARRSRGLVLPLAAWEVSRRRQSTAAVFLLVLGTAAATFGISFDATWSASQRDQAAARVGSQLSVDLGDASTLSQGRALSVALAGTGHGAVSPVTDRPVAIGSWSGTVGDASTASPRLVAVDTTQAAQLLSERSPGSGTWASLTAGLAPAPLVAPVPIASDATGVQVAVSGSGAVGGRPFALTPSVVVQDEWGARATLTGETVPLDGLSHEVALPFEASTLPMASRLTVVGVSLHLAADPTAAEAASAEVSPLTVEVEIPGAATAGSGEVPSWSASVATGALESVTGTAASAVHEGGATVLSATMSVAAFLLQYTPAEIMLMPFDAPTDVPVVVSRELATATGVTPGATMDLTVGSAQVQARVVAVTDYVPSEPGRPAVLADEDALSRAVLAQMDHGSLVDRWWVSGLADEAGAASAVQELRLGAPATVTGTTDVLLAGPLRVGIRAAVWVLVVAAAAAVLAGTSLHAAASTEARSIEVARLLGLGVPRRAVTASLVAQHAVVQLLVVAVGAVVGGLLSRVVGPLLAVSETGEAPIPAPTPDWPWPEQGVLLGGLLVTGVIVIVPVVRRMVRRAGAVGLRMDDAS